MEIEFCKGDWDLAKDCGAWLKIHVPTPQTATKWLDQMEPGKTYICKLSEKKKRRSLDANGRYWALCGKLSEKMGIPPEDIYRRHIRGIGCYTVLCVQETALDAFKRVWVSNHLGRFVETRESKLDGCVTVLAYYGSSDFDTRQMAQLIDHCVQDCKAVGVETMPPAELAALLESWEHEKKTDAKN